MHTQHAHLEPNVIWSLYSYLVTDAIVDLVSEKELVSDPEHVQDLVRVAAVALFEAADTFDPSSSVEFHDHASMLIHRVLYATLRRHTRRHTREISAYPRK